MLNPRSNCLFCCLIFLSLLLLLLHNHPIILIIIAKPTIFEQFLKHRLECSIGRSFVELQISALVEIVGKLWWVALAE